MWVGEKEVNNDFSKDKLLKNKMNTKPRNTVSKYHNNLMSSNLKILEYYENYIKLNSKIKKTNYGRCLLNVVLFRDWRVGRLAIQRFCWAMIY